MDPALLPPPALLTAPVVFAHATPLVQVIILGLVLATGAAIVVAALKLASGRRPSGGSAFLSGLRIGGPLAGLAGGGMGAFNMALGLSNHAPPPPVSVLAHGWAEIMMLITLGLLCGVVAVITNWAVEARADRAALRG